MSQLEELEQLRAKNTELLLLLGWIEQARTLAEVWALLDEFRKDFPVSPPVAETQTPAAGAAGGDR